MLKLGLLDVNLNIEAAYLGSILVYDSTDVEWKLLFDGVDENLSLTISGVQTPSTTFDVDFEMNIDSLEDVGDQIIKIGTTTNVYQLRIISPTVLRSSMVVNSVADNVDIPFPNIAFNIKIKDGDIFIDNVLVGSHTDRSFGTVNSTVTIASNYNDTNFVEMDLINFRYLTEVFPCNEGSGLTVTGSLGTVGTITRETMWELI